MYGTSDPLVGYAYRRCFRSVAGTPDRIAKAKRLITSSACGPSRCAPRTRSALSSMTTLNIAQVSATRRLEYQSEVSRILTRTSTCCSRASDSVRPTPASGGTVNTRSEEHTSELQSQSNLVCRLLLEKKKKNNKTI